MAPVTTFCTRTMPLSRVSVLATVTVFGPAAVTVVPVMTGASQRNAGSSLGGSEVPSVAEHSAVTGIVVGQQHAGRVDRNLDGAARGDGFGPVVGARPGDRVGEGRVEDALRPGVALDQSDRRGDPDDVVADRDGLRRVLLHGDGAVDGLVGGVPPGVGLRRRRPPTGAASVAVQSEPTGMLSWVTLPSAGTVEQIDAARPAVQGDRET